MIKFLPKNLDLKKLLADNPPEFKYHIDHFVHLCSLIYEMPAKKKDCMRPGGFVPLNSFMLKTVNNRYKRYLKYLIQYGVFECDNSYIVGEKSKCYRYAEKYHDIIQPVYITKYTLTSKLKEVHRFNRDMYAKYNYLNRWFSKDLTIEYAGAQQKLVELYYQDKEKGKPNALHKLNANMVNLIKLDRKDFYFTVDSTSKRLHTLLTKLKKELRDYITYDCQPLANVDFQCSQPTLSLCLLDPTFYNTELKQDRVTVNALYPELAELLPIQTIASYVQANQDKFIQYREMVFKDLYISMGEVLNDNSIGFPTDRKSLKSMMYVVMFSHNKFIGGKKALPKRIFKQLFPEVYEVFKMYKTAGQQHLPILLQKIEATLVLDRIAKSLSKASPGMPLFTVHDSIVCPTEKIGFCKEIIWKESLKYLGFEPVLGIDRWGYPTEKETCYGPNSQQYNISGSGCPKDAI